MSRSVTIPTGSPPSTTMMLPMFRRIILFNASLSGCLGLTVSTFVDITDLRMSSKTSDKGNAGNYYIEEIKVLSNFEFAAHRLKCGNREVLPIRRVAGTSTRSF